MSYIELGKSEIELLNDKVLEIRDIVSLDGKVRKTLTSSEINRVYEHLSALNIDLEDMLKGM